MVWWGNFRTFAPRIFNNGFKFMERIIICNRTQKKSGKVRLRFRLRDGRKVDITHKSEIVAELTDLAKFNVDGTKKERVSIFNEELEKAIKEEKQVMATVYRSMRDRGVEIDSETYEMEIDKVLHPAKYVQVAVAGKTFYDLAEEYVKKRELAEPHARTLKTLFRAVSRYEGFVRATQRERRKFTFDVNTVTKEDIEDFGDYLRNEHELAQEYPTIFAKLTASYPASLKDGNNVIQKRGKNTVIKQMTRLKSLFAFFRDQEYCNNDPFKGVEIGTETVGMPYYITLDERNLIAEADLLTAWKQLGDDEKRRVSLPIDTIMAQRDIFIFQCCVGCRVGDLLRLSEKNIVDGLLVYTPHKTKDEGKDAVQARVPLIRRATELIEKYRGIDRKGRLFPFISAQRYNDAIKVIFKFAGVTRNVEIHNSITGQFEMVPINDVASSHLARRTFVGNLYFNTPDPSIIGKMSGHVDGSKAFKRYRKIEDETLKTVIKGLE